MTKQESVQRAYQWATRVYQEPKSPCVLKLCALQLKSAVESNERYDDAYAAIESLVSEWRGQKKEYLDRVLKIVGPMLVQERERAH